VRPSASNTGGSREPAPVRRRRRRRMRRSRFLPATVWGHRPRGKHASGQVHRGITQRCVDHLLPRQSLRVAHEVRQVRIELNRSRCGAVTPENPARSSRTPPSPRAAEARTEIGLICKGPIIHIALPFCARVGSCHNDAAGREAGPRDLTAHASLAYWGTTAPRKKQGTKYDSRIARAIFASAQVSGERRVVRSAWGGAERAIVFRTGTFRSRPQILRTADPGGHRGWTGGSDRGLDRRV
jgi:hypothetical protein